MKIIVKIIGSFLFIFGIYGLFMLVPVYNPPPHIDGYFSLYPFAFAIPLLGALYAILIGLSALWRK